MTTDRPEPKPEPPASGFDAVPKAVVDALRSGAVDVTSLVHRLQDAQLLAHPDLLESLAQIRRGEVTVVRPIAEGPRPAAE